MSPSSSPPPAYSEMPPVPPRKPVNSAVPATYQSPPSLPSSSGPYMPMPSSTSASGQWLGPDPRSSSTQSLLPDTSLDNHTTPHGDFLGRRKLLIIYIHGFLGNDQSFRSFPAHVHSLLANLLADSHVIHSKIYPRYKTYRSVDVARDNFSEWLRPHESPTTDVILVGHSMGGILAADVVLMPNPDPYGTHPLKHRIIGHVSLDCPFIGLHPGIVVSGISSLFKPAPTPPQDDNQETAVPGSPETSSLADPSISSLYLTNTESSGLGSSTSLPSVASSSRLPRDQFQNQPFFNQPFFNDSGLQERPFVQRMFHFANKYRNEGLIQAAARHMFSYLEFGSCLADPAGLEARYRNLRALEDVDEFQSGDIKPGSSQHMARVRFVNYYTLCTGRPKTPKGTPKVGSPRTENPTSADASLNLSHDSASSSSVELDFSPNRVDAEDSSDLYARQESPMPSITLEHRDTMGNAKNHQTLLDAETKTLNPRASNTTIKGTSIAEDESVTSGMNRLSIHSIDPTPIDEDIASPPPQDTVPAGPHDQDPIASIESNDAEPPKIDADLPPLPDPPEAPELPDPSQYTEKDERKQVEREVKRLRRAYENAVKDHAKAIREREKLVEKRQKRAQKESEKALKEAARREKESLKESQKKEKDAEKEQQRQASEREKQAQTELDDDEDYQQFKAEEEESQREAEAEAVTEARGLKSEKPKKLRKFCNLPTKGGRVEDPTWVDIYMADVDEVGAHCGLFFSGPHYEKLVGDVGNRIVGWVQDDLTKRTIQDMGM
ncbi:hypothetical protein FPSE_11858 [Fusarium pseudograminearum CS3096]|uniref:DUF676 domain-containing protein n=1 Tax=Fusarium pseudograminearum (strain CS3096) TaxID=1028729 RepID=K3V4J5_FUSPC|nr:hypothetical protein FPSE_11858 [Fusarium pseudograminearum CS3096]EKJ68047.1 hypothetical protein FPSE_11858 [Fusarium pseudograminearum CS3096]KAF0643353.1 hypothetical protein FPSE5266_11858 [Fusarium pseudograminearum]